MRFPFGQEVKKVEQADRSPKLVFCLGVYASAVHARWIGPDNRTRIRAVAVASEPEIFWRGNGAEEIIANINVPPTAGRLEPAAQKMNGPSGVTLDTRFIAPLKAYGRKMTRNDFWLCDLLPYSRLNNNQREALSDRYDSVAEEWGLPEYNLPGVPDVLATNARCQEIYDELLRSTARIIMLLGDKPIEYFIGWLARNHAPSLLRLPNLRSFGATQPQYGKLHEFTMYGSSYYLLPLAHPRQAGRLGAASPLWGGLHDYWVNNTAGELFNVIFPAPDVERFVTWECSEYVSIHRSNCGCLGRQGGNVNEPPYLWHETFQEALAYANRRGGEVRNHTPHCAP
jgi:hypothetical protein